MKNMTYPKWWPRLMTILLYAPIILGIVLFPDPLPFFIMILLGAFISLQEMYNMYNLKNGKVHDHFYFGYVATAILLLSVFMQEVRFVWENYIFLTISILAILFFIFELFREKIYFADNQYAYLLRSILYIGLMYSYIILLRGLGLKYCLYLISIVWINDIFAYIIGLPLGKHKLSPKVSPKKSIEGAIGAVLGAVLMSTNLRFLVADMSILEAIFLGLGISVLAQVGDLVESLLKREYHIKDSGSLIPGHGGILDRMDSFILTFPLFYYFVYFFVK